MIDLHTHSTASDGTLAPTELVHAARDAGLEVLALTDHDTTDGLAEAEAAAADVGITLVSGVELNCDVPDAHADILGYLFDPDDPDLQVLLTRIVDARVDRAREMVRKLRELGAPVTFEEVVARSERGAIGRPHVAQVLVDHGFVETTGDAFRHYIGHRGPAYADRYRLTPVEACQAIRDAGGVPGLAHPVPASDPNRDPLGLRTFLPDLVDAGLGALECYYPGYKPDTVRWMLALAHHFGLVPTGGSDFHGAFRPDRPLGCVDLPPDTLERLENAR